MARRTWPVAAADLAGGGGFGDFEAPSGQAE
jgi:hypothetical protein